MTQVIAAEKATGELIPQSLIQQIEDARPLEVKNLVIPILDSRDYRDPLFVPNPRTGSWNMIMGYMERPGKNFHVVLVDLSTGEVKHDHHDKELIQEFIVTPEGVALAHGYKGVYWYDAATNSAKFLEGSTNIPGETRPMTIGHDGLVYGTGSIKGRAVTYTINPKNGEFNYVGPIGPSHAPNRCWGYFIRVDGQYTYIASGKIPWHLVSYDRQSGEMKVLLTHEDPEGLIGFDSLEGRMITTVRDSKAKKTTRYWLGQNQLTPITPENEKNPPAHAGKAVPPQPKRAVPKVTGDRSPDTQGNVTQIVTMPDGKVQEIKFQVPVYPTTIYQAIQGPDGKIYGSGGVYMGMYVYDPTTNTSVHHKGSLGSMPGMAWLDGKLYTCAYPSGMFMVFDPTQPVDNAVNNLRRLLYLAHHGSGIHRVTDVVAAADNKVYAIGNWHRNGDGGGVGWYDPATGKAGGTHEGMAHYRCTHAVVTGKGRYLVISTTTVRDQVTGKPAPDTAKIFVLDTQTGTFNSYPTIKGIKHTGTIAAVDEGTTVVAMARHPDDGEHSLLYAFDALTGKILWQKRLPYHHGLPPIGNFDNSVGYDVRLGPDGKIWFYTGGKMKVVDPDRDWGVSYEDARLARVDAATGQIEVVGLIGPVGKMLFVDKDLYLTGSSKYHLPGSGSEYLRRIKGILP